MVASSNRKSSSSKKKSKASNVKVTKMEPKPVSKTMLGASFTRLRPITIESGWLTRVNIVGDGTIELKNSWTDFILTLLGLIYSNNQDKFMRVLADNNVLSDGVNINTTLIKYPEVSEVKYEVYKLNNSPYYIEFRQDGEDYIHAIKGLLRALKIDTKNISFDIEPLNITLNGVNTTYKDVEQLIITEKLTSLLNKNKLDIDITALTVFGYKQKVKSTSQALILFMTWALASYGKTLEDAGVKHSLAGVGMTTASNIDMYSEGFTTVKIGNKYLYCCEDNVSILKYLSNVALNIGISTELIEIEYKVLELI